MSMPGAARRAEAMSLRTAIAASFAVFGVSLTFLLLLGRYLHIVPGSPASHELDVLFGVDGATQWKRLSGISPPWFGVHHFLLDHFWGRLGAVLAQLLKYAQPSEAAHFNAAVGLVRAVAAIGFGGLALISLRLNPRRWNLLLLFPVCLLFTANTIIVQPDHFGLSFGLLGAASLVLLASLKDRTRGALVGVAGFLNAVTTVTNVLFPIWAAFIAFRGHITRANAKFLAYGLLAAGVAGAPMVAAAVVQWDLVGKTVVQSYLSLRLISAPSDAARFAGSGLLYPAVGPTPAVLPADPTITAAPPRSHDYPHLSYETSRLSDYGVLSGVAACAWIALLAASSFVVARSPDLRDYCYALFGWIAFNLVFHNIWGDEFFLFSAHWSWALMLIVLLGSRGLPTWLVALAVALIIPGQLSTLSTIRALVFA